MPAQREYPQELRDRAVRLVAEAMAEDPKLSLNAATKRIGPKVAMVPDTPAGVDRAGSGRRWRPSGHHHRGRQEDQATRVRGSRGKGANQAAAAAKLGASVEIVGCVGTDEYGRLLSGSLVDAGVDVAGLMTVDGPSGLAMIVVTPDGAVRLANNVGAHAVQRHGAQASYPGYDDLDDGDRVTLQRNQGQLT